MYKPRTKRSQSSPSLCSSPPFLTGTVLTFSVLIDCPTLSPVRPPVVCPASSLVALRNVPTAVRSGPLSSVC